MQAGVMEVTRVRIKREKHEITIYEEEKGDASADLMRLEQEVNKHLC